MDKTAARQSKDLSFRYGQSLGYKAIWSNLKITGNAKGNKTHTQENM
jgi:hypothetical protein